MKLEIKFVGLNCEKYIFHCNICNAYIEKTEKNNDYKYCPYCGKKVGEEYET